METCLIHLLPQDSLHQIFSSLSIREILICRSLSKFFNQTLTSPSFINLLSLKPPLNLIALRPSHHHHHHRSVVSPHSYLHVYDSSCFASTPSKCWMKFPFDFIPFRSSIPVASSLGLVYLWVDSPDSSKSLVLCNPLTRKFQVLPALGSAWSRHGTVLVGPVNRVLVLTELACLYFNGVGDSWQKFSSNLVSKPRSPILVFDSLFALCDVGSPWRSQWKLFSCTLSELERSQGWKRLEKHEWGDIFDILKRPRLIRGNGKRILMVGGLKSSFSLNASCSTILILRLDLDTLEWDEVGRMPTDMFRSFQESSKFKVFGGGDRVCFSGKRIGRLAMWDNSNKAGKGEWRWVDGIPGNGDGLYRGFEYEARFTSVP
ncbi:hypothetical protein MKW94_014533 [Papaver nudicaule]|uniref:F-box domain-containing protein n=1 Tax=Papaver nudicaule TaxID=74823 RepID=A0AA42ATC5_PAPNU|nr:hypothetical protein [Papaver nudicaule]